MLNTILNELKDIILQISLEKISIQNRLVSG